MLRDSVRKVARKGVKASQVRRVSSSLSKPVDGTIKSVEPKTTYATSSTSAPARKQPVEAQYNFDIMARALEPAPTPKPYVRTIEPASNQPAVPMDGNQAAAYVAYAWSETSFIYPISPATAMGEHMDNWASQGRKNVLGQIVKVTVMQSEAGAAGACHGAVTGGVLTSSFTASQGLLLMIPNLYLMAGELMPVVLHVSARTVAKHALSIFNDHSDVMACRQTGFAQLCSNSVQEVMDLGLVAHVATIRAKIPFMHFFDGFRTSHEIAKIRTIQYKDMERLMPYDELQRNLRDLALNPQHPIIRGTGQRPDIFFQQSMAATRIFDAAPDVVEAVMKEVGQLTGRTYNLFDYIGAPDAEHLVVMMGSGAETAEEVITFLNSKGDKKTGLIKVRLYRPWSAQRFLATMPKGIKRITVLDKTKEEGAQANPLYLDVACTIMDAKVPGIEIYGGTYGLGSKEFTPGQFKTVLDNMSSAEPRRRFVVGIHDDVTGLSLSADESFSSAPEGTKQCVFWGLGGDGTIGANKAAIKNLALDGGLEAQAYFSYDSHKEMGSTVSHLRFGKTPIKGHYTIVNGADYVACHHPSYVRKFDLLAAIREKGIFLVNCPWSTLEAVEEYFPNRIKRDIATKKVKLVTIDATKLALDLGLGMRINTLMQSCFYTLSGVLPVEKALELLRHSIKDLYSKKGPDVVAANTKAVDAATNAMFEITYPVEKWAKLDPNADRGQRQLVTHNNVPTGVNSLVDKFVHTIMDPVLALEGDQLPVSTFVPGGYMPAATCMHERRGLAAQVPVWEADKCTQCNYCVIVCPHAVIRPFLLDRNDIKGAPEGFLTRKATGGAEYAGMSFSIIVSTEDCTGCKLCVQTCPDDALHMEPYAQVSKKFSHHWDYAINLPKRNPADKGTVKGSQFQQPLMEFSGACPGCGETPYVTLASRLFGDRMVIANASGCSSVWGGTATTNPYTVNEFGRGPAWGRSLFEDNAEYGFGMAMATKQRRQKVKADVEEALAKVEMSKSLRSAFEGWLENYGSYDRIDRFVTWIEQMLPPVAKTNPVLTRIFESMDVLRPQSHWIVGGDGWAYDIGFGGLDHVLSRGENVNILVLDTEMYSNTGGQVSKSTQKSTVLKFAQSGKPEMKKDLGAMAMTYGNVYVASVALGANFNQCVQAFKEAESYDGPSLLLCYSPCIDWGIDMQYQMESQRIAVDSGYWRLYRYDPRLAAQGKIPMQLDSPKIKTDVTKFLETQNRFKQLVRKDKQKASSYFQSLKVHLSSTHEKAKRDAMDNLELLDHLKAMVGETSTGEKVAILYASETGTAAEVAKMLSQELKRRGVRAKATACDDYDFESLPSESKLILIGATCGQGEFPANSKAFWKALSNPQLPTSFLAHTSYAVFGLGDTAYVYYNKVGKDFDARLNELGAKRLVTLGLGNEKDDEKWETGFSGWVPDLYSELGTQAPPEELPTPVFTVQKVEQGKLSATTSVVVPKGARLIPMKVNKLLSPEGYDRDIRHYEFDLGGQVSYNLGDSLGVYPWNKKADVTAFLKWYGLEPNQVLAIKDSLNTGKFPDVATAEQIFTQVLDMFGRPNRRFYEMLALVAKDPKEKEEITYLMSKAGAKAFKAFLQETPTFFDLLQKWPSAKLSLEHLLEFVPTIRPRLYSIASAPDVDGENLHLCIVFDDWTTPSGRYRHGLTTGYLKELAATPHHSVPVACRVNNASFTLPANHQQPLIMVALGTGIAPMRALIRDRLKARDQGVKVGPMALFFGVRYKKSEYSYGEYWDSLHAGGTGPLTILEGAFSRDQKQKIYVQDKLAVHKKTLYDWIVKDNGYYILCGPSGPPCAASRAAIVDSLVTCGKAEGFDKAKAEQYVTDMQLSGRFNEEVW